ncbi:AsnC family transcriptional regulator [Desulfosarcina ovata subsp. ovata]|uniref:AsnC family transcriptional regulator n=2 Tax=Desulfosarcina ovata TaxID=83564 RepID=A0A5K8A983_9BACT|nr:AsnC family transcriptional regulator [Desulfosarcina ovata subsp. ovata]
MDRLIEKMLDGIGRKILAALQENARISFSRLGKRVGLSSPAVTERVKKMEEAGVIRGYHAHIDPAVLGRAVTAFIQLTTDARHYPAVQKVAAGLSEVLACHHISGNASFLIQVRVGDVADLETVVARFSPYGQTRTAIVLSTSVDKGGRLPLE